MILDDFAGPGGWSQGAKLLGLKDFGVELDETANRTATLAGHERTTASSVTHATPPDLDGYISSPPCVMFAATRGKGNAAESIPLLVNEVMRTLLGYEPTPSLHQQISDGLRFDYAVRGISFTDESLASDTGKALLVLVPARRIVEGQPTWIAFEQVLMVAPIWSAYARGLRLMGYQAGVVAVNAADYGCAQTRRRVILMATRDRTCQPLSPPPPTHAKGSNTRARPKWRTMREEIGVGLTAPIWSIIGSAGFGDGGDYEAKVRASLGGRNLTQAERGILQTFPADYPWQGTLTQQRLQVGNAVPPRLAAHILGHLTRQPSYGERIADHYAADRAARLRKPHQRTRTRETA